MNASWTYKNLTKMAASPQETALLTDVAIRFYQLRYGRSERRAVRFARKLRRMMGNA